MLHKRSVFPWLKDAIIDWVVIAVAIAAAGIWNNPLGYVAAVIVVGNRQHALACLGHDGTHFLLSTKRKLNDTLSGFLAWYPLGITNSGYRSLHNRHHIYLNTEDDPEIHHKRSRAPQWDIPITPQRIIMYVLLDLVGYSIPDYYIIVTYSKATRKTEYVLLAAYHLSFIAVFLAAGLWWVPLIWYVSLVTSFMMFFRLRLWLEHQGTDLVHRLELNGWQSALFYPHLAWHHWEHHQWPAVPYHRLPELRKMVEDVPVITLQQLWEHFNSLPNISSGTPLSNGIPADSA
ncbi:MAG: fatty acid desaturase [Micavibrio aeruginosavorus]|uniref:Fatty acid desaturase n=1 Tax=Micavibrio aeruginosavorus TaxID=349221 RepID=A0A7T5UI44_9BACT|nr:MAG: fatty acid desaturase [Micavibrio aeruginosavorus]